MPKMLAAAAAVLAASLALPAGAAPSASADRPLTLRLDQGYVPRSPGGLNLGNSGRTTAGIIATDALYGGIAGLAIGAGVALLEGSNNWGRDLSVGAGAGILIGAVFGAVDAASTADRIATVDQPRDRDAAPMRRAAGLGARF